MKCKLALLMALGITVLCQTASATLDPFYHTNAEITQQLLARQQQYPDTVKVDTIGYSQQDHLPILAVKVSDHVQVSEDEPRVLLVGQVHAEEILGVEIVMCFLDTLLAKRASYPYKFWLQELEIWLIPTANPEGHQVVMDEWDLSYRKNKRDVNLNTIFNYHVGVGLDTDGVDINRNFPLNWVHGDTFLQPGSTEIYDYYRGASPLSESETQALWDFGIEQKFSFSIVWHSSRTGNNSEKVFYPWDWDGSKKYAPDSLVLNEVAFSVANAIPRLFEIGQYQAYQSDAPRGQQHDAFYAATGTIPLLIECGTADLQPAAGTALNVIADNFLGITYLLNRASVYNSAINHAELTGTVKNPAGTPLPAIVEIVQMQGPMIEPRVCDAFGRYRRFVTPGVYDVRVQLRGYYSQDSTVVANSSGRTTRNFVLQPKPTYQYNGLVRSLTGVPLPATLFINGEDVVDTVVITGNGQFSHPLPEGDYSLLVDSPGYVVAFNSLPLYADHSDTFNLAEQHIGFFDDFSNGLSNWTHGGTKDHWGTEITDSGMVATDSPGSNYLPNTSSWLRLVGLNLSACTTASLTFQHWYYLEPDYDQGKVQVSTNGGTTWATLAGPFDKQNSGWQTSYGNLTSYCGHNNVILRWYLHTDTTLCEEGWRLNRVLIVGDDTITGIPSAEPQPSQYTLVSVYPNPFNAQVSLQIKLSAPQFTTVSLWDITGRKVAQIHSGSLPAGDNRLTYRMPEQQASGIYILRVEQPDRTELRKLLFLK
jgi:hypothetical protein